MQMQINEGIDASDYHLFTAHIFFHMQIFNNEFVLIFKKTSLKIHFQVTNNCPDS